MLRSFRSRLALWHAFILTTTLAAGGSVLFLALREFLLRKVDASLMALAETEVASAFDDPLREVHLHEPVPGLGSPGVGQIDKMVQILALSGEVIARSSNLGPLQLPHSPKVRDRVRRGRAVFETVADFHGQKVRIVSVPVRLGGEVKYVLQVGASLEGVRSTMSEILWLLAVLGTTSLVLSTTSGYLLARKSLRPIREIANQARHIGETDLSRRLEPVSSDDEIENLTQVLNDMLSRVQVGLESQRQFLAGASHEIRSPLSVLKGEIEVALRRSRDAEEYRAVLRSNLEEVNRLSRLVGDLLTLARIDYGGIHLRREPLRIGTMLADAVERNRPRALSRGQTIRMDESGDAIVEADADLIRQLFDNLLDNALKYSPRGAEVRARIRCGDGLARIEVRDTGPGIPASELDRIFERFYRCDRARSGDPAGTGLGLSICKWITEAHRGRIGVRSREGEGSTFVVEIPCGRPPS
ncbi:MAG: sensor histidine kinase [Acidobacteriota bacterium]